MPYINIRIGTTLDTSQRNQLYERTTTLMNTLMGKRREVTVVHVQESPAQHWSVNADTLSADDPVVAFVDIKVTEGTNSPKQKAEMLSETGRMLRETVGVMQEACYVVIDDISADSWGYNGLSQADRAASRL